MGANSTPAPYADAFITTPELNGIVNQSFRELYGITTTAYANGYNASEKQAIFPARSTQVRPETPTRQSSAAALEAHA